MGKTRVLRGRAESPSDPTPEQAAFLKGRSWGRDRAGHIIVYVDGPVRGKIPRGITIRTTGNRAIARHGVRTPRAPQTAGITARLMADAVKAVADDPKPAQ